MLKWEGEEYGMLPSGYGLVLGEVQTFSSK